MVSHLWRRLARVCAWAALAALAPMPGAAAPPALQLVTGSVTITVPVSAFDSATGQAVVTNSAGLLLQVNSSKNWTLQVRATSANFTDVTSPGTGGSMPVAQLQLRPAVGGAAIVVSTAYRTVETGPKTSKWDDCALDVILTVTSANAAGQYTATLEFKVN